MTKFLFTITSTMFIGISAHAANWYCGPFTKFPPQHQIFGVIGDHQHGPAIVKNFTKDPKKLKKYLQQNACYCIKGNLVYTKQFGNTFKKMNQIAWCPQRGESVEDLIVQ